MIILKSQYIAILFVLLGLFSQNIIAADIEAGKNKAAMCQGCHGVNGNSSNSAWPNLAGQQANYLENQLKAFKSGTRNNPIMKGIATGLNEKDIENVAAFFASQPPKSAGGDAFLAKKGKGKVTMCMGCHGNNLQGRNTFPRLAGQYPQYLAKQLAAFKNGERKGGPMGTIAKNLSAQDIKEITAYIGSL